MHHAKLLRLSLLATSALTLGTIAFASQAIAQAADGIETVIVTGTRDAQRTAYDSMAPIDVLSGKALQGTVSNDLNNKLAELIPSFKVQRLPMADGAVFVRPATLRNLSPDQTLVLVNGKRQHRSAMLGGNGAEGVDLSQIPDYAIKRIEVLRDGAAAQYGSDAIAGVINIILDDETDYRGFTQASQYYEGDGTQYQAGIKGGVGIGGGGFFSGTLQWSNAGATSRSVQRPDAIAFQAANPAIKVANPVQHWGQPDLRTIQAEYNSRIPLGDGVEAYSFGMASWSNGVSDFNWRNPASTSAYKTTPIYPSYDLNTIYPAGFTPRFAQKERDQSLVGGIRGGTDLSWDISASYGRNQIAYYLADSINASFGSDSPTSFYLGKLTQEELNQNADFVYPWTVGALAGPINVAFGAEHRQETYGIGAGDPMSYETGPAAVDGLPSGANGFPGYSSDQAGHWNINSYAGYLDLEAPITDAWTVGAAGRYESYSDFGDTFNYKVSTRYQINDAIALRGTYSTGFRAPTPGQVYSTRTSQGLDTTTLNLFTRGRLSPLSPVAQYFGAKPLKPEKSRNASVGAVFRLADNFTASVDAYQIEVRDRFGTSANYTITSAIRSQLIAQGVPGADSITTVNFFTNAYSTRTRGIDLVGTYVMDLGPGSLTINGAANFNQTKVTHTDGTFSPSTIVTMEDHLPKIAGNLSANYAFDRYDITGKVRFYGPWTDVSGNATGDIYQHFGSMALFDLAVGMNITDKIRAVAGAENLFNSYPDKATFQANRGLLYSRNAPYDTDGGQYYLRLDVKI